MEAINNLRQLGDVIIAAWASLAYNHSQNPNFLFVELHDAVISDVYFKRPEYEEVSIVNTNHTENRISIKYDKGKATIKIIRPGLIEGKEFVVDGVVESHINKHGSRINISIRRK